jgi:carrier protein
MDRVAHSLLQAGVATVSHPLAYAKTLIQIGYEPMPPVQSTTLLGKPVLMYPSVLKYIGHIKRTDGFFGLYRGLGPRLASTFISTYVSNVVSAQLIGQPLYAELTGKDDIAEGGKPAQTGLRKLVVDTSCESLARCAGVIASQPFYVIVVRSMCQFVGQETKYSSITSSFSEIYNNEGILGFFSGLVPRLLGELFTIWLANSIMYVINNFVVSGDQPGSKDMKTYSGPFSQLIASQITYPFVLVSTIMAVNDSGLMASSLCEGAIYSGWIDCWSRLSKQAQLKRGSSLFWRRYTGPSRVSRDGQLIAEVVPNF